MPGTQKEEKRYIEKCLILGPGHPLPTEATNDAFCIIFLDIFYAYTSNFVSTFLLFLKKCNMLYILLFNLTYFRDKFIFYIKCHLYVSTEYFSFRGVINHY